METTIFNENKLKEHEIEEVVTRVKVFLMNNNGELLLANANGCYMLPGGHVEENEELTTAVLREVEEETGIKLNSNELVEPFYQVKHYTKNHYRNHKNRLSAIIYYFVKTDKNIDLNNLNLTENEKENNFQIKFFTLEEFEKALIDTKTTSTSEHNSIIAGEILYAYDYLKAHLNIKNV